MQHYSEQITFLDIIQREIIYGSLLEKESLHSKRIWRMSIYDACEYIIKHSPAQNIRNIPTNCIEYGDYGKQKLCCREFCSEFIRCDAGKIRMTFDRTLSSTQPYKFCCYMMDILFEMRISEQPHKADPDSLESHKLKRQHSRLQSAYTDIESDYDSVFDSKSVFDLQEFQRSTSHYPSSCIDFNQVSNMRERSPSCPNLSKVSEKCEPFSFIKLRSQGSIELVYPDAQSTSL